MNAPLSIGIGEQSGGGAIVVNDIEVVAASVPHLELWKTEMRGWRKLYVWAEGRDRRYCCVGVALGFRLRILLRGRCTGCQTQETNC